MKTNGVWHCPHFFTRDLIIVDQDRGVRSEVPLKTLFPGTEYRAHVHDTTAGPLWGSASLPFIVRLEGRDYFYMRCWTGKQLLLALDTAQLEVPGKFATQLADQERKHVLATLTSGISELQSGSGILGDELDGAILIAAARGQTEARPLLETVEALSGRYGPFGFIPRYSYGASWGGVDMKSYTIAEHRQFAQLALRRLGFAPKGYPAIIFGETNRDLVLSPENRAAGISRLRSGQSSREVHQLVGPPDYLETAVEEKPGVAPIDWYRKWVDGWRYDFARPADCSVLIIWNDEGRVERIEKITPGLWHGDELFTIKTETPVFAPNGSMNSLRLYSADFRGKIEVLVPDPAQNQPQGAAPNAAPPHR